MKVLKRATNAIASLVHVTNYQQFTVGHKERQSEDSTIAKVQIENLCKASC